MASKCAGRRKSEPHQALLCSTNVSMRTYTSGVTSGSPNNNTFLHTQTHLPNTHMHTHIHTHTNTLTSTPVTNMTGSKLYSFYMHAHTRTRTHAHTHMHTHTLTSTPVTNMTGSRLYSFLGSESTILFSRVLHAQPSRYNPYTNTPSLGPSLRPSKSCTG